MKTIINVAKVMAILLCISLETQAEVPSSWFGWSAPYQIKQSSTWNLRYWIYQKAGQVFIGTDKTIGTQSMFDNDEGNTKVWEISTWSKYVNSPLKWRIPKGETDHLELADLWIGDRMYNIGAWWFTNVLSLESILFAAGDEKILTLTKIGKGAFKDCVNLKDMFHFENHPIETIDESAFENCKSLTWINLSPSMRNINRKAFAGCTGLQRMAIWAGNPPSIEASVFEGIDLSTVRLEVSDGCLKSYMDADVWREFGRFKNRSGDQEFTSCRGITVSGEEMVLKEETISLIHSITPGDATFKNVIWSSSDPSIATVDNNGNVKGIGKGECTITVTTEYGRRQASKKIVVEPKLKGIALSASTVVLEEESSTALHVSPVPFYIGSEVLHVTWCTSNSEILQLSPDGLSCTVTGLVPGKATVYAISAEGLRSGEVEVTVTAMFRDLLLDMKQFTGNIGEKFVIGGATTPAERKITWSVLDPGIATINESDNSCEVTLISKGTTYVLAKYGEIVKDCKITVKNPLDSEISLNMYSYRGYTGETFTLQASTFGEVRWSTSNPDVAIISELGQSCKVSVVGVGEAVITATLSDEIRATCNVTAIAETAAKKIILNRTDIHLDVKETVTLEVKHEEGTQFEEEIKWTVDDKRGLLISPNDKLCLVNAIKPGVYNVTASHKDAKATATITVRGENVTMTGIQSIGSDVAEIISVYSLNGELLYKGSANKWKSKRAGIVIIRDSEGKIQKQFIK